MYETSALNADFIRLSLVLEIADATADYGLDDTQRRRSLSEASVLRCRNKVADIADFYRAVRRNGKWRQLHHHGSIEKANLLANYQRLIFGAPL